MGSTQDFVRELDVCIQSGEGVIFIATTEVQRAIESIDALTSQYQGNENNLLLWKINNGISDVLSEGVVSEIKNPALNADGMAIMALNQFKDSGSIVGKNKYMVMNWLHRYIPDSTVLVQELHDCSILLPHVECNDGQKKGKCVFCIVPPEWDSVQGLEEVPIVSLKRPTVKELEVELVDLLENSVSDENKPEYDSVDLLRIAENAAGMTEHQAISAFSSVLYKNKSLLPNLEASVFASEVSYFKTQAVEKSPVLTVEKPVDISQVGGLDTIKADMEIMASCMSKEARELGIDSPKGIFLSGPPGVGKSLIAKAISGIMGVMLVSFDLSRVFGGFVGQSEKNIKSALDIIDSLGNVVVLVDEIDKVLSNSTGGDSGTSSRVLGSLLTHMQENSNGTFWVFTANRTDNLPPELLRRGRMDELYSVSTPNHTERLAIFEIHLKKRGLGIPDDIQLAVSASDNYVPAELESAVVQTMRETFTDRGDVEITGEEIARTLSGIKPLSSIFADDFNKMKQWGEDHAKSASLLDHLTPAAVIPVRRKRVSVA